VYGITYATCTSQIPGIMFESVGPERYPQAMAMANVMLGLGDMLGAIYGGKFWGLFDPIFVLGICLPYPGTYRRGLPHGRFFLGYNIIFFIYIN
jgi:hypothetical protein